MSTPNAPGRGERPGGHGPRGGGPWGGAIGRPVEKAKDFKGSLRRLLGYFRPEGARLLVVLLAAIASTAFNIWSPKILGSATTILFAGMMAKLHGVPGATIDFQAIGRIVEELLLLYGLSAGFALVQQYTMAGVAQRTVYRLRREVQEKLSLLPLRFYDEHPHGDVMSRFVNDFDNIQSTLQQSLTQSVTSVVTLIGVMVMMLSISGVMTLAIFLTLPLSMVIVQAVARRSQRYFLAQQRELGILNAHVEDVYTGHKIVKAFGRERDAIQTFREANERLYAAGWRAQFMSGIIMPLMQSVGNLGFVLVSVIGGVLVTRRAIAIGDVQALIQYSRQFTQPITQLSSIANLIQSTIASSERVFEVLDETEERDAEGAAERMPPPRGAVELRHVHFSYRQGEPVIEDLCLHVSPGETIAIVGPTGAGKTTLVQLLIRFYDLDSGQILIDGVDAARLPRQSVRRLFGMVLQDTWLFHGTIRQNIAYGKEGATEEEIIAAADAAHADHFIRTLPEGYDTVLNEEASNISQGQRQLLTIARAVLSDPPILILDEATSNVDTRTELQIQRAMAALMQGRTTFVIAHRLSTIRDADRILVVHHGRLVEQGRHEELLAAGGFYADLYQSQFAAPEEAVG